jgi:hypothetical protein
LVQDGRGEYVAEYDHVERIEDFLARLADTKK